MKWPHDEIKQPLQEGQPLFFSRSGLIRSRPPPVIEKTANPTPRQYRHESRGKQQQEIEHAVVESIFQQGEKGAGGPMGWQKGRGR